MTNRTTSLLKYTENNIDIMIKSKMKNIKICISIIYVILSVKSLKSLHVLQNKRIHKNSKNSNNKLQSIFPNSLIPIQK